MSLLPRVPPGPCAPLLSLLLSVLAPLSADTVALWTFDEPLDLYPSHVLDTVAGLEAPLTLGLGGTLVAGKFGHALSARPYRHALEIPASSSSPGRAEEFGQIDLPPPPGKTQKPLSWHNAHFAAFMTGGENHLRREVAYINPSRSGLNLGPAGWTLEFWFLPEAGAAASHPRGVVFEMGHGERGETGNVTLTLALAPAAPAFTFHHSGTGRTFSLRTQAGLAHNPGAWRHLAFVLDPASQQLRHYVDGRRVDAVSAAGWAALPLGDLAYLSFLRDGLWAHPLPGAIDELRISDAALYAADFTPPGSFAPVYPQPELLAGPPLLFAPGAPQPGIVPLGSRKHLFLDGALIASSRNITFTVNPPRVTHRVLDSIEGPFRKHLTVVEDENGLIRLFNGGPDDYLMVHVSRDGIHFEAPDTGLSHRGRDNIVIAESTAMGSPMIDPNGPPEHRWKYITGHAQRGTYLYTSPDGWRWRRVPTASHSFRSGSQTSFFYDDQRQTYVAYQRTGMTHTRGQATQRSFILTETRDPFHPWPWQALNQEETRGLARSRRLRQPYPWFLDNGPLTPGDFGLEAPIKFEALDDFDPEGVGIYVPKAHKYPWAPDAYVAFPLMYFHYDPEDGPPERWILGHPSQGRGSGVVEAQLAVSRDGRNWTRYPRPVYAGIGDYLGRYVPQAYLAEGLIRRGHEIWQYLYGPGIYHSSYTKDDTSDAVYRLVQRLDGFVSADAPYDAHGFLTTRPLTFTGGRLQLNLDTGATGYAQVGFLDLEGQPIPGFGLDNCVYLNGDWVDHTVAFRTTETTVTSDLSALAGRPVQLIFRLRGSKLYAFQFVP